MKWMIVSGAIILFAAFIFIMTMSMLALNSKREREAEKILEEKERNLHGNER